METTPYYRLDQLILEKYGEKNYAFGFYIVARWLSGETKQLIPYQVIERIAKATQASDATLTIKELTALQKLFKLQSPKELFTTPQNFITQS